MCFYQNVMSVSDSFIRSVQLLWKNQIEIYEYYSHITQTKCACLFLRH